MTDLRTRAAEMLAYESNPSRDEWRKLVAEMEASLASAEADARRFEWALPILCVRGVEGDERGIALAVAFLQGKDGRDAIDAAMEKPR